MRQSQSLSFQSSNLQQQLLNKFKGYGTYNSGLISAADMQGKYQQWSDDTTSSIATTMAGLGMQNAQIADEDALMRRLEQMRKIGRASQRERWCTPVSIHGVV